MSRCVSCGVPRPSRKEGGQCFRCVQGRRILPLTAFEQARRTAPVSVATLPTACRRCGGPLEHQVAHGFAGYELVCLLCGRLAARLRRVTRREP